MSVRVGLASGEIFYVDAEMTNVVHTIEKAKRFAYLGTRLVNPAQVAVLQFVPDEHVSTTEIIERLEN